MRTKQSCVGLTMSMRQSLNTKRTQMSSNITRQLFRVHIINIHITLY